MKVPFRAVELGFYNWFNAEIATMSWKMMGIGAILPVILENMKKKYQDIINLIVDSEGNIDIEMIHKQYAEVFNKKGNVTFAGINFTTQDLDKLYEYVKGAVPLVPTIPN